MALRLMCNLTVKLRGRTMPADGGRGPTMSRRCRGPNQEAPHAPLQRLLAFGRKFFAHDAPN